MKLKHVVGRDPRKSVGSPFTCPMTSIFLSLTIDKSNFEMFFNSDGQIFGVEPGAVLQRPPM